MKGKMRYQYLVEGECERKLIQILKENSLIISGKVDLLNVVQEKLTNMRLRPLLEKTIVILVFDTDIQDTKILHENIRILHADSRVNAVWCVPQVLNLEDELIRSTNIREIKELLNCQSNKDFKHSFIQERRLMEKLQLHAFDINSFWAAKVPDNFVGIPNDGERIKLC